jgi:hypothetical protein
MMTLGHTFGSTHERKIDFVARTPPCMENLAKPRTLPQLIPIESALVDSQV